MKIIQTEYSLRNGEFFVNSEHVPTSSRIIRTALEAHRIESGWLLDPQSTILPETAARHILRMESARSIASLAAELSRLERAEKAA